MPVKRLAASGTAPRRVRPNNVHSTTTKGSEDEPAAPVLAPEELDEEVKRWHEALPTILKAIEYGYLDEHLGMIGRAAKGRWSKLNPNGAAPRWLRQSDISLLSLLNNNRVASSGVSNGRSKAPSGYFPYRGQFYLKASVEGNYFRVPGNWTYPRDCQGLIGQVVAVGYKKINYRMVQLPPDIKPDSELAMKLATREYNVPLDQWGFILEPSGSAVGSPI